MFIVYIVLVTERRSSILSIFRVITPLKMISDEMAIELTIRR